MPNTRENRKKLSVFQANLKRIRENRDVSQKDFAKELGISHSTLCEYEKGSSIPKPTFLMELKERYQISLDDLLYNANFVPPQKMDGGEAALANRDPSLYVGNYYLYLHDTNPPEEQSGNAYFQPVSLSYGLLTILPPSENQCSDVPLQVRAVFHLEEEKLDEMYRQSGLYQSSEVEKVYEGYMTVSSHNIIFHLSYRDHDDAMIALRLPHRIKECYYGGLGTINSISRGNRPLPCIQCIGLSRNRLVENPERIASFLNLAAYKPDMENEAVEMQQLIHTLYTNEVTCDLFQERQKRALIQSHLELYMQNQMRKSVLNMVRITDEQDGEWYHLITRRGER